MIDLKKYGSNFHPLALDETQVEASLDEGVTWSAMGVAIVDALLVDTPTEEVTKVLNNIVFLLREIILIEHEESDMKSMVEALTLPSPTMNRKEQIPRLAAMASIMESALRFGIGLGFCAATEFTPENKKDLLAIMMEQMGALKKEEPLLQEIYERLNSASDSSQGHTSERPAGVDQELE